MKIVADRAIPFVERLFSTISDVVLVDGSQISSADLSDADALIVRTVTAVNRNLLQGSRVRLVATASSGIDHVDIRYLQDQGIFFASAAGCNARSVAEYILSSLFVLAEQQQIDLSAKTVGIIGCGHVGTILYGFMKILGIRCLLSDPPLQRIGSTLPLQALEDVLCADIISLHVPLIEYGLDSTLHLLDSKRLAALKRDVILINTSRGGVIDEAALLNFIDTRPDSAVVLDVWENEPAINQELLAKVSIATPHIAGYSTDAKLEGTLTAFRHTCRFFNLEFDESVIPAIPVPELNRIGLSGYQTPLDAIHSAVLASYDVRTDSGALRYMLGMDSQGRAAYFSGLRNKYPLRREFSQMTAVLDDKLQSLDCQLSGLGFTVVNNPVKH